MPETTPRRPSSSASRGRIHTLKRLIVLAAAAGSAGVFALVASDTVGVTAATAAQDANAGPNSAGDPGAGATQGPAGGGFFGVPNTQPRFFSGPGGAFGGSNGTFGGFGGSSGSVGGFGSGTSPLGAGPMMQSGGS